MPRTATGTLSILHVAYSNAAGVPGRWAQAHRALGQDAELVLEVPDEYGYGPEATVLRWSSHPGPEIMWRIQQADVVMVYDSPFYLRLALELEKPVLYRALGSHARRTVAETRELLCSSLVRRASAGTADLALALGIELAGAPYPKVRRANPTRHVAVHSPSNRLIKGTDTIRELAFEAEWPLEVLDGVSNEVVLYAKRSCQVVIDHFGSPPIPDGIGVAAIEAMAMGLPVVGRATVPVQRAYREVGCPAILVNTEAGFVRALRRLHDPALRLELGEASREWVRSFHDGLSRAREDMASL